ncbi:MAG: tyrosine-type recombinase/integrase [bacterium]|nr:tyrosine-type recombinase/integrase [bacterium]
MFHHKKRGEKGIYYVYWRENGCQRSKAVGTDLESVNKFKSELANRLYVKKEFHSAKNIAFNDFCDEYIELYSKANKRERTIERDSFTIQVFKKFSPNVRTINQFANISVNNYKLKRKKRGLNDSTINRELDTLKSMLKYAYKRQYLGRDYSSDIMKFPRFKISKDFVLSENDIIKIFNYLKNPYKTAFLIALYSGMRRGEVCHLEWGDVDFNKNIMLVQDKPHLNWAPKNNASIRTVPIHPDLKSYLLKLKKKAKNKTDFLCFFEDDYEPIKEINLTAEFTRLKKHFKLPKEFCFHALRHTFVSKMGEEGVPTYHISKIIGHSSTIMTEQVYTAIER